MTQLRMLAGIFAVSWLPWFDKKDPPRNQYSQSRANSRIVEEELPPEPPAPVLFPDPLPFHPTLDVTGLGMTYANSCAGCHNTAFAQWNDSTHHLGVQSTDWLDAIREFGDGTVCSSCHRPLTVQHEELTTEIIEDDIARPVMEKKIQPGTRLGIVNRSDVPHVTYERVWSSAQRRQTPPMQFEIQPPYNVLNPSILPSVSTTQRRCTHLQHLSRMEKTLRTHLQVFNVKTVI